MDKIWEILKPDAQKVQDIVCSSRIDPILAQLLVNRDIWKADDVESFLSPGLDRLRPPFSLCDAPVAAQRISNAIVNKEKILIFGDYDADGITASAVVYEFLKSVEADVSVFIPDRLTEGYGLRPEQITHQILPKKINLIITVDCGSGSHGAVAAASQAGIDVIVTDHHRVTGPLPGALAVINPNRPDCPSCLGHLAGVGVAFFLIIVLRRVLREMGFWKDRPEPNLLYFCDLVALGTIADMAPMIHENRILVSEGLHLIKSGRRISLRALAECTGTRIESIDSEAVAFRLSPRINAAGRISHANSAFDLIQETDLMKAREKSRKLNELNSQRQGIEKNILDEINLFLSNHPEMLKRRSLVLSGPDWHEGVLGIVASKLVEKYYRIVVLISTRGSLGKGSARGISGLNLFGFISQCNAALQDFGGHETAAGLTLKAADIHAFSSALEEAVSKGSRPDDFIPRIRIDRELHFHDVTSELLDALERLAPHGPGNPPPLFMATGVRVDSTRILGNAHVKMRLSQASNGRLISMDAIRFNAGTDILKKSTFSRIAYRLAWNNWQGRKTPQAIVEEAV